MRHLLANALLCLLALALELALACAEELATTEFARLGPIVVHGNEADNLLLGAGVFDIRDRTSAAGTIEYRFGRKVFVAGLARAHGEHRRGAVRVRRHLRRSVIQEDLLHAADRDGRLSRW